MTHRATDNSKALNAFLEGAVGDLAQFGAVVVQGPDVPSNESRRGSSRNGQR